MPKSQAHKELFEEPTTSRGKIVETILDPLHYQVIVFSLFLAQKQKLPREVRKHLDYFTKNAKKNQGRVYHKNLLFPLGTHYQRANLSEILVLPKLNRRGYVLHSIHYEDFRKGRSWRTYSCWGYYLSFIFTGIKGNETVKYPEPHIIESWFRSLSEPIYSGETTHWAFPLQGNPSVTSKRLNFVFRMETGGKNNPYRNKLITKIGISPKGILTNK